MGRTELSDELSDNAVDIPAGDCILEQRAVLNAHGLPVNTVHALIIEEIPTQPPGISEDLLPFGPRVNDHFQFVFPEYFLHILLGFYIDDGCILSLPDKSLFTIRRKAVAIHIIEIGLFLALLEPILKNLRLKRRGIRHEADFKTSFTLLPQCDFDLADLVASREENPELIPCFL